MKSPGTKSNVTSEPAFLLSWDPDKPHVPEELLTREWILTNGLGGYASGTLSGVPTRRYHGFLVAALPAPAGRQLYFNHLSELVTFPDGSTAFLSLALEALGDAETKHFRLREFHLEEGMPVWRYTFGKYAIERRITMPHMQNTVQIHYELRADTERLNLRLQPSVHFRGHDDRPELLDLTNVYTLRELEGRFEIIAGESTLPPLRLHLEAEEKAFLANATQAKLLYREEQNRGYPCDGSLWSPGYFETFLSPGQSVTLFASTDPWEAVLAQKGEEAREAEKERRRQLIQAAPEELRENPAAQLVLAADQFVIIPASRIEDAARAYAMGAEPRSIIAGYHWFTDWGRDTMISLEGLTLNTGRQAEARWILNTFALHLRDGLVPNYFPEGLSEGVYHTADATLWFFHALSRYADISGDDDCIRSLLPKLIEIIDWHKRGTQFGIGMDPEDKLMRQGAAGYQLTWMDAKVDDWVVTPRRGKAVEINALWYNALRLLEGWLAKTGDEKDASSTRALADEVYGSFNKRFWNEGAGHLFDVVDGPEGENDAVCRPNQIFSFSLEHPVLAEKYWAPVLDTVKSKLLTPVGLRSLSSDHPDYKPTYSGNLRARDAAYHQGTVWGWLIGPFIDAWLRVYPNRQREARDFLQGFVAHLSEAGLGTISEIFDAKAPFTPRGCIAQAWSVAEVLRCWKKTAGVPG